MNFARIAGKHWLVYGSHTQLTKMNKTRIHNMYAWIFKAFHYSLVYCSGPTYFTEYIYMYVCMFVCVYVCVCVCK